MATVNNLPCEAQQNAPQNWENANQIQKCVAVFAKQKPSNLHWVALQNGKKMEIATQIQKCVAVFATHKKRPKLFTGRAVFI